MPGFTDHGALLRKLGKHRKGVSCLYIESLDDVHVPTLTTLVRQSVKRMKKMVAERASPHTSDSGKELTSNRRRRER